MLMDKNDKKAVVNYSMVQTVKGNKKFFSNSTIKRDEDSIDIQEYIAWPGTEIYKRYINESHVNNFPVTSDDARRARVIYGEPTPLLQGRMTRMKPIKALMASRELLEQEILKTIGRVQLFVDIFYINGDPFFHTKSEKLGLYRHST